MEQKRLLVDFVNLLVQRPPPGPSPAAANLSLEIFSANFRCEVISLQQRLGSPGLDGVLDDLLRLFNGVVDDKSFDSDLVNDGKVTRPAPTSASIC
jgi:hypothetical protein